MTGNGRARRLLRVSRTVADLDQAIAFYRDVLSFSVVKETVSDEPAWGALMGLPGARGHAAILRLGTQELELIVFDPPGRAYPPQSRSTDRWFQHIAIVVADMDAAYTQLCRHPFAAITEGGPQLLPPGTGSVTAFKFRDPDGHPLELIHFPPGTGDALWQRRQGEGVFLGLDHSAIGVADTEGSIAFYTRLLGFDVAARSINSGPEQARLDRLSDDVRVNVVALQPAQAGSPHVELLGYERPAGRPFPADAKSNDIFADRLVLEVEGLPHLVRALTTGPIEFVSPDSVRLSDGRIAALVCDPSGHRLMLIESSVS